MHPTEFSLERRPEGLHGRVVVTVTGRSIGRDQTELSESVGEVERGVLTPLVAVVAELGAGCTFGPWPWSPPRSLQLAGLPVAVGHPHRAPATEVPHAGEEELPLPSRTLGHVSHPPLIGSQRLPESSGLQQVTRPERRLPGPSSLLLLEHMDADQVHLGPSARATRLRKTVVPSRQSWPWILGAP